MLLSQCNDKEKIIKDMKNRELWSDVYDVNTAQVRISCYDMTLFML
jgi:hypothetical protein